MTCPGCGGEKEVVDCRFEPPKRGRRKLGGGRWRSGGGDRRELVLEGIPQAQC